MEKVHFQVQVAISFLPFITIWEKMHLQKFVRTDKYPILALKKEIIYLKPLRKCYNA